MFNLSSRMLICMVHGHGYADAHAFVRSFAAFPEHPGSNVSLWIIICRVIDAFEAGSF